MSIPKFSGRWSRNRLRRHEPNMRSNSDVRARKVISPQAIAASQAVTVEKSPLHSSCQQPPKPSRENPLQTGSARRTPRFVNISQHWIVWEVLPQDFHPVCEVVFAHRIQWVWLKEKLWRGLLKNCVAWSSPFAVWTEIIALGIRKLHSASQASSTIVGVDLPVGRVTMRAA